MAQQSSKPARRWRWALGVSVALNLLVVAALAGAALRGGGKPDRGASQMRGSPPYFQALSPEDRAGLRQLMRRDRGADRQQRRAHFRQVLDLMQADSFDAEALRQVLAAQNATLSQRRGSVQDAWLDKISAMDSAERAAYAARLEEILSRGPRGGKRKKGD